MGRVVRPGKAPEMNTASPEVKAKQREIRRMSTENRMRRMMFELPQRNVPTAVIYQFPLVGARSKA